MVSPSYFPFKFTGTCGSLAEILAVTCPSEVLERLLFSSHIPPN